MPSPEENGELELEFSKEKPSEPPLAKTGFREIPRAGEPKSSREIESPKPPESLDKAPPDFLNLNYEFPDARLLHDSGFRGDPWIVFLFASVMRDLKAIDPTGVHEHYRHRYSTEYDLTEAIRPLLAENGIGLAATIERFDRFTRDFTDGRTGETKTVEYTTVFLWITAAAVNSTTGRTTFAQFRSIGEGDGDKGLSKAVTAALRVWLQKTFLVGASPEEETASGSAGNQRPAGSWKNDAITNPQRKRLFALGAKLSHDEIGAIVKRITGEESTTKITRGKYEEVEKAIRAANDSRLTAEDIPF